MISVSLLPKILQEFCAAHNYVSSAATAAEQKTDETPADEAEVDFDNMPASAPME